MVCIPILIASHLVSEVSKVGMIYTLAYRCFKICSDCTKFHEELDMLVTVIVMQVTILFEIEVKNLIFYRKQFFDNEYSITLETLENNKIWICRKHSHPCTTTFKQ